MVNIQRVSRNRPAPEPEHDPYALLPVTINGRECLGRPIAWDSEPAHNNTVLNLQGRPVLPTRCVVQCAECGAGLELPITFGQHPAVSCRDLIDCPRYPRPQQLPDPFQNPYELGLMAVEAIDSPLLDVLAAPAPPSGTVAERLARLRPEQAGDQASSQP